MNVSKTALVIAASQGGAPAWVTPLIAAGAAIIATLVTALSSAYVARRRVAELELGNSFELAKQYVESARNYTESVYLPLAVELYKLQKAFSTYKVHKQTYKVTEKRGSQPPRERLENDFRLFVHTVGELFLRGAAAVIAVQLEMDITGFISFLQESMTTERVVKTRSTLENFARTGLSALALVTPILGLATVIPTKQLLEFGIGPTAQHEIAAAPIGSDQFEKQFALYISAISSGIKRVTLGAYKE